jgi:hypothetical protein
MGTGVNKQDKLDGTCGTRANMWKLVAALYNACS